MARSNPSSMSDPVIQGEYVDPTVTTTSGNPPATPTASRTVAARVQMSQSMTFQGPIPPPEILRQYNDIIPDGADRILKMAEAQSAHRIELEAIVIKGDDRRADRGLTTGFTVCVLVLVLSFIIVMYGHDAAGTVLGTLDIASLVGIFVYGRRVKKKELERRDSKNQALVRKKR